MADRTHAHGSILLALLAAAGCSARPNGFPDRSDPAGDAAADVATSDVRTGPDVSFDVQPLSDGTAADVDVGDMTIVYAHSHAILYSYDPRTRAFTTIGPFVWPPDYDVTRADSGSGMTDCAVDAMGHLVGVTWDALFRIDPTNAHTQLITILPGGGAFGRQYVGLTFVPVGALDPSSEVLVGGAGDGSFWRIDPTTGASSMLGTLGDGWLFDGDMVSVAGAGTFATVVGSHDLDPMISTLVQFDLHTGAVTVVGETGYRQLYGIAYWRSTLYGFSGTGEFISMNASTGVGALVSTPVREFWGAGSTTTAPTAPP